MLLSNGLNVWQVFQASWHGTEVAVKVLNAANLEMLLEHELLNDVEKGWAEAQQQFEHEAALLSRLRHPNIVSFLGFAMNGDDVSYGPVSFVHHVFGFFCSFV
jgi:serine/threonine protein kinase